MGFVKSTSSTRCRYAACFTLGFVVASIVLAAMFWIIWCYLGLTIVQVSDTQRRALVNYSYTTPKPSTTVRPNNRTEAEGALESSLNAISKSQVTPPTQTRRRSDSSADLAKGDFAARPQGGASQNSTRRESIAPSVLSSANEEKSSILSGEEEGGLHTRKISTSNSENRAQEESLPERDIKPTQTYAPAQSDPLPVPARDERRPISRDSDGKDDIQGSRPSYREPDFEREPPPRRSDPARRRYDDDEDYDDRGSPSRYDKRDRGRDTDDRYSKGDTRVYPDERPRLDDRYPPRDSDRRRGDDRDREDRYRDRDDGYKYPDDRYKSRDPEYRYKDDPYYKDDRRIDYDDRYRPRDDRYDDRYRPRDERYRDDEKYKDSSFDGRRDRYRPRDDEDRYTRTKERDDREPILSSRDDILSDRKRGRPDDERRPTDYDVRDRSRTSYIDETRIDDRYLSPDDDYRRPSKYDDGDRISPSKTRDDDYILRSTESMSRSRDDDFKSRPSVIVERKRDDDSYSSNRGIPKYDGDNRRVDETRYISPSSIRETDSTRRVVNRDRQDDGGLERRSYSTDEYRRGGSRTTYYDDADRRTSEDSRRGYRIEDDPPRRPITDEEYPRSRPRGDYDTDRSRVPDKYDRPIDDDRPSRRYVPEYDEPRRRSDADIGLRKESYPRDAVDEDRMRPEVRRPLPPSTDRRYDDDIPPRRPVSDDRPHRSRPDTIDDRPLRPAILRDSENRRPYRDDTYPEDDRRYKDEISSNPDDSPRYAPPRSGKREPFVSSSTSPRDVVSRDKSYHNSGRTSDDYGKDYERPINTKDVIEAALKHSDGPNHNLRKVSYPVFDPRVSNLTSTDIIPPSDRRGTTIMSRRRRSFFYLPYSPLPHYVVVRKKRHNYPE